MAKIKSLRHSDETSISPPADCSYFEEMCWRAENETCLEKRVCAQFEVDRMVDAMNDAAQEDRMNIKDSIIDHLNSEVCSLFDAIHFEANDKRVRGLVEAAVRHTMTTIWNKGHVADFTVVCDESNNPPSVIDSGELEVTIAFRQPGTPDFEYVKYTKQGLSAVDVDLTVGGVTANNGNSSSGGYGSISVNASSIGNMVGHLTAGSTITAAPSTFAAGYGYGYGITMAEPEQKQVAELPAIVFDCKDENGSIIKMELKPEGSIGTFEALQLMMMLQAATASPLSFSPYLFVKKHNLERHFKFSV